MPRRSSTKVKENINENVENKTLNRLTSKQTYWILGIMTVLLATILITYWARESYYSFDYQGLHFTREMYGKITVFHYFYYLKDSSNKTYQYNLYLRNDPRENNVSIMGNIRYYKDKYTYISVNTTGLINCSDGPMAVGSLSAFLTNNFITVRAATTEANSSTMKNVPVVTCDTYPDNTVIILQTANSTQVEKKGNSCHIIKIAQCSDALPAVEKFEIQSILDAKLG